LALWQLVQEMSFIEKIIDRLKQTPERAVIQQLQDHSVCSVTGSQLLALIRAARAFIKKVGLKRGDRCALLAHNSIRWAAMDIALMAEGIIVVPLYTRQSPAELITMIKDCEASLVCCGDQSLLDALRQNWPGAPTCLLDEAFACDAHSAEDTPESLADSDPVTIIYTSGTSGEPKGVILNAGNLNFMLACTNARLDLLMGASREPDRVFHYLPFCFAGSWILLLTCLSRNSLLTLSTDLNKLGDQIKLAAPNYFLNVPALLERMRSAIEDRLSEKGGIVLMIYQRGKAAWFRRREGKAKGLDWLWLALADRIVLPAIRKSFGPNLRALICGSAPLAKETQLFFFMLGIPVLQVYGLTETTAICTMDHPHQVRPGRVGPAIPGIEMKLGENDEILVRGPNIFPGYWNRPDQTASAFKNGWFRTGDQGEVDEIGNWAIVGRIKNLIILSSGHNVAPEPIEQMLLRSLPGAQQVMLVGNGRSYLSALITGNVTNDEVEAALVMVNAELPHYKRIRAFYICNEPFTIENGLLTANGKLKREAIALRLKKQIEDLYRSKLS
jgi:long-chain acyl-CoA synthetase